MKKKFILIFSLIILSVFVFAFSSSASNYFNISDLPSDYITYGGFEIYSEGNLPMYNNERLGVIIFYGSIPKVGFMNIEGWHNFIESNNISSSNSLYETVLSFTGQSNLEGILQMYPDLFWQNYQDYLSTLNVKTYEDGYLVGYDEGLRYLSTHTSYVIERYLSYCSTLNIEKSLDSFEEYVSNNFAQYYSYYELGLVDLAEFFNSANLGSAEYDEYIYNQGKIDGVTEFKGTEEYKEQYTTGYTDGINNFKETELQEMLALEKQIGQAEGKNIYLASEEYADVLKAEYDNGYNAAVNENDKTQIKNSLGVIIGSCGLVVIFLLSFYFITSKKRHKRR